MFLAIDFPLLFPLVFGSNMVASTKAAGLGSEVWRKLQCSLRTGLALETLCGSRTASDLVCV